MPRKVVEYIIRISASDLYRHLHWTSPGIKGTPKG